MNATASPATTVMTARQIVPGPDGPATLPGLYSNYNDLTQYSDVFRMSWDHTFGATKFNHFYAGGNNWRQNHDSPQEYIGNWKDKLCLPNVPDCNLNLLNLTFNNSYGGWGGPANNGSENTVYAFNDDFTWVKGAHTLKFGGMYQLTHYNGFGRQCVSGCAGFSYTETGRGGDTNFATSGGNAFASFLLGWADSGSLDTIRFIGQQWPYFAGFAQDDWRVNSKSEMRQRRAGTRDHARDWRGRHARNWNWPLRWCTHWEARQTAKVLECYRLRWQHRSVQTFEIGDPVGHVPKQDDQSSRAWLYGKLFVALLSQKLARVGSVVSPGLLLARTSLRYGVGGVNSSSPFTD